MARAHLIEEAVRTGAKARISLSGPTGSGKTFSALMIAQELAGPNGKIVVIDTERKSAPLYSDKYKFKVIDWRPPYDPRELADDIKTLSSEYDVIDIDSITHFWQGEGGTLDIVDAAGSRSGGNNFAGWKTGTPAQNGLVEAMLAADCHVIATMRSKMEHVLEKDPRTGKMAPVKVGMSPIQRDGIEYEFTIGGELDMEHRLIITKSRYDAIADQTFLREKVRDMASEVKQWLESAPAIDLTHFINQTVTEPASRRALGEAWRSNIEFGFRSNAVPLEFELAARELIRSFGPVDEQPEVDEQAEMDRAVADAKEGFDDEDNAQQEPDDEPEIPIWSDEA